MGATMKFINTLSDIAVSFLQVIYRYVIGVSLSFSEELARYMFIWTVAMGSALALKTRSHIGVEILVERLPKPMAKQARLVVSLVSLAFYGLLIWYGFDMTFESMDQESAALELSMGYVYLAVPLSGIVLFICEIKNSMDDIYGTQGVDESVKGGE
jgi:TRAP-type C4-dicarboxylate transport system permease small subunit